MIAVIQFKDVPGRRFEVLPAESGYCGTNKNPIQCAFFDEQCLGSPRFDMCLAAQVFFKEASRDDQE